MKVVIFRPEGAQDLAQGKAYSPPPWVTRHTNHLAALKGQDTAQQFSLAPLGRLNFTGASIPRAARSTACPGLGLVPLRGGK